jgi:hypothetical protein
MAKRIKWIAPDVSFSRGNYESVIAKFDNCKKWLRVGAVCSTQTAKSDFRKLAQEFGAETVEIKHLWGADEEPTEDRMNVVDFRQLSDGYWFYIEKAVPEGATREFIEFEASELFA